jgi:hypothetical protein
MSVTVMGLVWDSTLKGPNHRHVLLAMANIADDEGICWPGYGYLARRTDLSRRTVIRMVNDLEGQGWIVRDNERETAFGDQDTNMYWIDLDRLRANRQSPVRADDSAQVAKRARLAELRNRRSAGGDSVAPPPEDAANPGGKGSDTVTPPPAGVAPPQCQPGTTGSATATPNTSPHPPETQEDPPQPPAAAGGDASAAAEKLARCGHGRTSCRDCGTSPRAQAWAAQAEADAELKAAERIGKACQMCVADGPARGGGTRWLRALPGTQVVVTPYTPCDHETPHAEFMAGLAAADTDAPVRAKAAVAVSTAEGRARAREIGLARCKSSRPAADRVQDQRAEVSA